MHCFYICVVLKCKKHSYKKHILHQRDLGRIAGGMSCECLKRWVNESGFSELLQFITKLPGGLRPGLVRI